MNTWPASDFADAVKHLPPDSATHRAELGDLWDWNHLAANVADLVDLMTYWLHSEYAKWIHDPEDPATKRAEAERKRKKIKPPSEPLIQPVAHRPPSVAGKYAEQYLTRLSELGPSAGAEPRWMSSDAFDAALGL